MLDASIYKHFLHYYWGLQNVCILRYVVCGLVMPSKCVYTFTRKLTLTHFFLFNTIFDRSIIFEYLLKRVLWKLYFSYLICNREWWLIHIHCVCAHDRFCYLLTCGCVFSERALREVKTEICHKVRVKTDYELSYVIRTWLRNKSIRGYNYLLHLPK